MDNFEDKIETAREEREYLVLDNMEAGSFKHASTIKESQDNIPNGTIALQKSDFELPGYSVWHNETLVLVYKNTGMGLMRGYNTFSIVDGNLSTLHQGIEVGEENMSKLRTHFENHDEEKPGATKETRGKFKNLFRQFIR